MAFRFFEYVSIFWKYRNVTGELVSVFVIERLYIGPLLIYSDYIVLSIYSAVATPAYKVGV